MGCRCEKRKTASKKKSLNLYGAIKEEALHRLGITESPYVKEIVRYERLKLCLACESFFELTQNCKVCGCFVKMKIKYKDSECPLGKWDRDE